MKKNLFDRLIEASAINIYNEKLSNLINEIGNRSVIIYGAGPKGRCFYESITSDCTYNPVEVLCFVDDDITAEKKALCKKDVLTLEEAFSLYDIETPYIVATFWLETVEPKLIDKKIKNIFHYPELIIDTVSIDDLIMYKDEINSGYDLLIDEKSKRLYENILKVKLTRKLSLLDELYDSNFYFNRENIVLSDNETYVDVGAFNGHTIEAFINTVNNSYNKIIAFEINDLNFDELKKRTEGFTNIFLNKKALYNENTTLYFNDNIGDACSLDKNGRNEIEAVKLDNYYDMKPTFIKMDIEGAEKEALLGAVDIIRHTKAKLAICVYHKPEDIYEIPKVIHSIREDYEFCLRQHTVGQYDTILYAV
jgi:FkbM family methyltransferase